MEYRAVIDLHCDTLTRPAVGPSLDDSGAAFALSRLPEGVRWGQCCAIFVPDGLPPAEAAAFYDRYRDSFFRQMEALGGLVRPCRTAEDLEDAWGSGRTGVLLTVENGAALGGSLERIEELAADGVKLLTLTWNGVNELGSGKASDRGLTPFGRAAVRSLERAGIVPDVSHLNDRGFWELLDVARKPFAVTHSNARAVCRHPRNLTDGQIREMVRRGCLIGLNYCADFLRDDGKPAGREDLLRHIEHFLELGAEDCLALGSDLDGCDTPPDLAAPEDAAGLYGWLTGRGLPRETVEKLMYRNALAFFRGCFG